ncbi:MAG: prolipoprotein diacylglyceryl transferase [Anaerolineaceae bacterium]
MLPILQIGPLSVNASGLIILISLYIGVVQAEKASSKFGIPPEKISNLLFIALASALIGARLAYSARYPAVFLQNPASLINPSLTMLDLSGGILGSILAGLIYIQRSDMPFLRGFDAITPLLLVLAIGLGFSNLASGYSYGSPTNFPFSIYLWRDFRHPTQVYEILLALIWAYLLWPDNRRIHFVFLDHSGVRFLTFFVLSGFSRLLIEPFRGESTLYIGEIRFPQLLAFGFMLLTLGLMALRLNKQSGSIAYLERG